MPTHPTPGAEGNGTITSRFMPLVKLWTVMNLSDRTIKITGVYTQINPTEIKCLIFCSWHESP